MKEALPTCCVNDYVFNVFSVFNVFNMFNVSNVFNVFNVNGLIAIMLSEY